MFVQELASFTLRAMIYATHAQALSGSLLHPPLSNKRDRLSFNRRYECGNGQRDSFPRF